MASPDKMHCDKQITFGNTSYLCLLDLGHDGACQRPALDGLVGRDVTYHELPSVETTRQAIIDALVKAGVIGARQAVDRLIAAVEAKRDTNLIQPRPRVHLMECLSCHRFGTPISADEKVCGNCGNSTDTRMWFRELVEESK